MDRVPNKDIYIDGNSLDLATVIAISRRESGNCPTVKLSSVAQKKVKTSHAYITKLATGTKPIYGVNTGFGLLSDVKIEKSKLQQLQINLLRSHACGMGNPLSPPIVKAALLLRANTLAKGYSGCSSELIEAILNLLNKEIIPVVPEQGSVGACGDLAPLAHLSLVLIGEGEAYFQKKRMPGDRALKAAKLKPYKLKPKEGLSLINGTQIMTAIGAHTVHDAIATAKLADLAGALSLEAFRGTSQAFHPSIHEVRPHPQQQKVAENLRKILDKSGIAKSHTDCDRIQDPYSFRCMPQVHGVSREYIQQCKKIIEIEFNSSTDNPLVFTSRGEGKIISGGNFHGQYVAMAMDTLSIALAELANISEQRIEKLINPAISQLPAFLAKEPGLNSGMMIVQVAAASIVSENKILAHPAVVDSIPTSADKEDHVSMGVTAARKAFTILQNVQKVLAMEFLCASQGIEFHRPLKTSPGLEIVMSEIRKFVTPIHEDRAFHKDIEFILSIIQSGHLLRAVEQKIGRL